MKKDNIKVSTITVTLNRCKFLKKSIEYYKAQTHTNKEMCILYYDTDEETKTYLRSLSDEYKHEHQIRIFKYIPQENTYLGALRNFIVDKSTGDYIIIWDDDDYYAPERIDFQLSAILEKNLVACTLQSLIMFSEKRQEVLLSFRRVEGWEGTLMCKKSEMPSYRNIERYEDTPVLEQLFLNTNAEAVHNPELYVYHLHDNNISTSFHKEELIESSVKLNGQKSYEIKKLIGFIS